MNIVVTGANKGLGLCLVKIFAANGHCVAAGVRDINDAKQLTDYANSSRTKVTVLPMDVTDEASIQAAACHIQEMYGRLDVVVSNAGVLTPDDRAATITEIDVADLHKSIEVNTIGTIVVMKHFLPLMRTDSKGMMLYITSEAGSISSSGANFPAYSISKTAANKAVFILRATYGSEYVIYAVHPGRMNTEMGRATAQIEPEESADGIFRIATGLTKVKDNGTGFINYKGAAMPL